jgi:diguanylate cyclase (GGDEF)-like protein/PAS domain S-box-containing protein
MRAASRMLHESVDPSPFSAVAAALPADHLPRLIDPARLAALETTGLMDSAAEAAFDRFTKLAARWLGMPTALISLVDDHRQFFKSAVGLADPWAGKRETPLSHSFCQYAVTMQQPLVVTDAREHPWLRDNRAVAELDVVAYAGVPLVTSEEQVLGALCVIDSRPHAWTEEEIVVLRDLAELTMTEIELRSQLARMDALRVERGKERALLHSIVQSIPDSLVVADTRGDVMLLNPAAKRTLPQDIDPHGKRTASYGLFGADGATPLSMDDTPARRALTSGTVAEMELTVRLPGEAPAVYSVSAAPIRDAAGEIFATVSVGRNVTASRAAERALAHSEAILQGVVRHLPNGAVLLFDHDLRFLMADGEQLLAGVGLSRQALIGRTLAEVASAPGLAAVEPMYRDALAGKTTCSELVRDDKTFALTSTPVRDAAGNVTAGLLLVYDITAHKRAEALIRQEAAEVRSQSLCDELTGLYNRRGFLQLAREQLQLAEQTGRPALLFFVDLNGMKQINDRLGHDRGDQALVETAHLLRATFRGSDVLARLGGDEFVGLLLDTSTEQVPLFRERVQQELDMRNAAPGREFMLSVSLGAAVFDPRAPATIEGLLAEADALMYEQKRQRRAGRH